MGNTDDVMNKTLPPRSGGGNLRARKTQHCRERKVPATNIIVVVVVVVVVAAAAAAVVVDDDDD